MHWSNSDPLRDPVWQFVGVVVSIILGVVGMVLPYLIPIGKNKKENLSAAYRALLQRDRHLGFAGSLGLMFLLIADSYLLYLLLLRMFFLQHSLDQNTLLVTSFVIVFIITISFMSFKHSQLLLVLACF